MIIVLIKRKKSERIFLMKHTKIIFIVLFLLLKTKAHAIGSIDTTNVEHFLSTDSVPVFDPEAYVKGAVYFDNGFELTASSTLQFGSLGIVNETITFNGGTLQLTSDLHLGTNVRLAGPGYIDFNGHSIIMSDNVSMDEKFVIFGASPYSVFEGNGNTLEITSGASYITTVGEGSPMLRNMTIDGICNITPNNANFQRGDVIQADCCTFIFYAPGETVALNAFLKVNGICKIIAPYCTVGLDVIDSLAHQKAALEVSDNTSLTVAMRTVGYDIYSPLELTLNNNSSLNFINAGAFMDATKLIINGNVTLTSIPTLTFGDHESPTHDNDIVINSGSKLTIGYRTTINDDCTE